MKIKSIVSICKRAKIFRLYDGDDGTQWMGDMSAVYPLVKMPVRSFTRDCEVAFEIQQQREKK